MIRKRYKTAIMLTVLVLTLFAIAEVQSQRRRTTFITPEAAQPSEDHGHNDHERDVDWQGVVGGVLQGMADEAARPANRVPLRPVQPEYWPEVRPYNPEYVPRPQPQLVEPDILIQPGPPLEPNIIRVGPPPQQSPITGLVFEVSSREANCYAGELTHIMLESIEEVRSMMGKADADRAAIQPQLDTLQQLLATEVSWREIEPIVHELVQQSNAIAQPEAKRRCQHISQMALIRNAFLLVLHAHPRGHSGPLPIAAIPTGTIWILYDPLLPVGTGLLVTDNILVCGTGRAGQLQIAYTSAALALGLAVGAGKPVPDVDKGESQAAGGSIIIRHRDDASSAVNYVLNNRQAFTIKPGETQQLPADKQWVVQFDRGNNQGTARYSLSRGTYEFRLVDNRWDCLRVKYNITIDNRDGKQDFRYVVNNEVVTVDAGQSKLHESRDPLLVEFDRGAGPETAASKNLNKSGTYKVAVNTDTNYLDLYAVDETSNESAAAKAN